MPVKFDVTTRTPLTEGGEGFLYEYDGKIIKTFKPHIDLYAKERKIKALMKAGLPEAVVTPVDSVVDLRGGFIGYCMEKVSGEEFRRLSNRKFVTANNITTKEILDMLVKIKAVLKEIHGKNIYVGDLNDQNILFDKAGNIYFIDCDSWAIGSDTCTVAMDLFKDPNLREDHFDAGTDNYAFSVLAWKALTRIHPFGGTLSPDLSIMERMNRGISVIDRAEVRLPRMTKEWKGFSPALVAAFKNVFENGARTLSDHLEDMQNHLSFCRKDGEYYYSGFSSCPYCDSGAQVRKKPVSQGVVGGLKLYAIYDADKIKTVFDRYTYLDPEGYVNHGNQKEIYKGARHYFLENKTRVLDYADGFSFWPLNAEKSYQIRKKYKTQIETDGNAIYHIAEKNTLCKMEVTDNGNGIKNICKVSNTAYFAVSGDHYCVINYYTGKIIVSVDGTNTVMEYHSDLVNYGIHRDEISGKWLILLEDGSGRFLTCVINGGAAEYVTDSIKYTCPLNCPCIYNSNIFIPVDKKVRGYSYKKSEFKDFACSAVSEESRLIKEKNRFVIVNPENVYYFHM